MSIKPIQTKYKGYFFRSRLEARWAVFFDSLNIRYEYELEGFDLGYGRWYLPDFHLTEWDVWIEIKPVLPSEDFITTEDGDSVLLVIKDGKETDTAKEMMNIYALQEGLNKLQGNIHFIFYHSPYLPDIKVENGQWSLTDGCLGFSPVNWNGQMILNSWAFGMINGGSELGIWPYYMDKQYLTKEKIKKEDIQNNLMKGLYANPVLPDWFMPRIYLGKGIQYDTDRLMNAYKQARQARFS